jgi:hypothetical protein
LARVSVKRDVSKKKNAKDESGMSGKKRRRRGRRRKGQTEQIREESRVGRKTRHAAVDF